MVVLSIAKPTIEWYLILGAGLFALGMFGMLTRRNPLVMFMCVELMLNAVNLTFVAMAKKLNDLGGQIAVFFVLVVAAAEVVVGGGQITIQIRSAQGGVCTENYVWTAPAVQERN